MLSARYFPPKHRISANRYGVQAQDIRPALSQRRTPRLSFPLLTTEHTSSRNRLRYPCFTYRCPEMKSGNRSPAPSKTDTGRQFYDPRPTAPSETLYRRQPNNRVHRAYSQQKRHIHTRTGQTPNTTGASSFLVRQGRREWRSEERPIRRCRPATPRQRRKKPRHQLFATARALVCGEHEICRERMLLRHASPLNSSLLLPAAAAASAMPVRYAEEYAAAQPLFDEQIEIRRSRQTSQICRDSENRSTNRVNTRRARTPAPIEAAFGGEFAG